MATLAQLENAKRGRAFAWAKYYEAVIGDHNFNIGQYTAITNTYVGETELPKHLCDEFAAMAMALKKKIECPICLEVIQTEPNGVLKITNCGHKYCEPCYDQIDKCAICRKKIYKK